MPYFIWPTDTNRVVDTFGWRTHPISKRRNYHPAVDIAESGKHPIYAVADGVVISNDLDDSYGNHILIRHTVKGELFESLYAHMQDGVKVKPGDTVKQDEVIGYMGSTGNSTGQHLHFELHKGRWVSGRPNGVDPQEYLWQGFLKRNMRGPEVEDVQEFLQDLGFYKGKIDGSFGPMMENAVSQFQEKHGLEQDGIIGPNTFQKMFEYNKVPKWKQEFDSLIDEAIELGITDGSRPKDPLTREEGTVMIMRAIGISNKEKD